jgi:phage baseplate assembly protein W
MTAPQRSGWLFKGADFAGNGSVLARPEGVALTPAGRVALVSGDDAIRQSIILLLTTMPGERVMRPDYGCPLHRLLFAPNDATTAGLAIHYVRQSLVRFEPRIDIVSLDAQAAGASAGGATSADDARALDEASKLIVSLVYRVRSTNRQASLDLEVGLYG